MATTYTNVALDASGNFYTCPAGKTAIITFLSLCNVTTTAKQTSVKVNKGGIETSLVDTLSIPGKATITLTDAGRIVLVAGDVLYVADAGNDVHAFASIAEIE